MRNTRTERLASAALESPRDRARSLIVLLAGAVLPLVFSACQVGPPKPVALAPEDMCSYCRMAISNKRYAAEFIDKDGQAFKFDDIGCMVSYVNEKKDRDAIAATYVDDYDTAQWLKAEEARYVRSKSFDTPMSFGIVAFKAADKAAAAREKYKAEAIAFEDLFRAVESPQGLAERR